MTIGNLTEHEYRSLVAVNQSEFYPLSPIHSTSALAYLYEVRLTVGREGRFVTTLA